MLFYTLRSAYSDSVVDYVSNVTLHPPVQIPQLSSEQEEQTTVHLFKE